MQHNVFVPLVSTPDRALLVFLAGLLLVYFEFVRPGRVLPGVAGAVLVALAAIAFGRFSLDGSGLALILGGVALMAAQAFVRAYWIPGVAAALLLTAGARSLVDAPEPVSTAVSLAVLPVSGITVFLLRIAVRARRNKLAKG